MHFFDHIKNGTISLIALILTTVLLPDLAAADLVCEPHDPKKTFHIAGEFTECPNTIVGEMVVTHQLDEDNGGSTVPILSRQRPVFQLAWILEEVLRQNNVDSLRRVCLYTTMKLGNQGGPGDLWTVECALPLIKFTN